MNFDEELRNAMITYKPIRPNDFIFREIVEKYYLSKQEVKKAILAYLTDWKYEDITCDCDNCSNVKGNLAERDKLLKKLGLSEE